MTTASGARGHPCGTLLVTCAASLETSRPIWIQRCWLFQTHPARLNHMGSNPTFSEAGQSQPRVNVVEALFHIQRDQGVLSRASVKVSFQHGQGISSRSALNRTM